MIKLQETERIMKNIRNKINLLERLRTALERLKQSIESRNSGRRRKRTTYNLITVNEDGGITVSPFCDYNDSFTASPDGIIYHVTDLLNDTVFQSPEDQLLCIGDLLESLADAVAFGQISINATKIDALTEIIDITKETIFGGINSNYESLVKFHWQLGYLYRKIRISEGLGHIHPPTQDDILIKVVQIVNA
ncbi:uncharacterized protein LOC135208247 [Macrobrachium nipponense]|uniref:uncharacterized protein LOC135208247 n=1 Tax=Macrobrachium nipponense TaxID=159736 RepID=UPI0030C7F9B3